MIRETADGVLLEIKVKPGSRRFALYEKDGKLILEVTSPPHEGKANLEIVKGLKRLLGKDVEIVSGFKAKDKVILVRGANKEDVEKTLACPLPDLHYKR